jgi:hypothetical protein
VVLSGAAYDNLRSAGGAIYWYDYQVGTVIKAQPDGSNIVAIVGNLASGDFLVDGTSVYASRFDGIVAAALADGATRVVLAGANLTVMAQNSTSLIFLEGTALKLVAKTGGSATLIADTGRPAAVVADATTAYWTLPDAGSVMKASLSGGGAVSFATGQEAPHDVLIAGGWLYWTARSGLSRMPLAGGALEMLGPWSYRLVADANHLYTTTGTAGGVIRYDLADPTRWLTIAMRPTALHTLTADASSIYWQETVTSTVCPCKVMRLAK